MTIGTSIAPENIDDHLLWLHAFRPPRCGHEHKQQTHQQHQEWSYSSRTHNRSQLQKVIPISYYWATDGLSDRQANITLHLSQAIYLQNIAALKSNSIANR